MEAEKSKKVKIMKKIFTTLVILSIFMLQIMTADAANYDS